MEYLDQVLKGALRMYLCTYLLASRKCTKHYKLLIAHFAVEKDTMVPVLILKIHYDQEYYSNSDKFNPKHSKRLTGNLDIVTCLFLLEKKEEKRKGADQSWFSLALVELGVWCQLNT
jgi:hypothetical protein